MPKARSLSPSQLNRVLKRCLLMPNAELKRAALVLSFSTLRVSELAQVTIKDLMLPTGELKSELPLRAALCKRRKPRTIWLSSQARQLLQEWLNYRKCKRWGLSSSDEYQLAMSTNALSLIAKFCIAIAVGHTLLKPNIERH